MIKPIKGYEGLYTIDEYGNVYISIIEASRELGIPRSTIQYHLKNNTGEYEYE